jgi:urea transport system substrate-binding protein
MKSITLCAAAAAAVLAVSFSGCSKKAAADDTVKVGVLHSLSGTMAISETSVRDAEMLAINEINASGGVLGKKIVAVEEDGASDPQIFAEKARKLLSNDKVATIFGCWTSASRKAVKPVVEELHGLLWYPVQYEGMEASPDIMYMGAAPNQQAVPAVDFCADKFGKNMFLVGSDYVFPRTANKIIKEQLSHLSGTVAGEEYTPLGHTDYATIVSKIQAAKPDCIINTLNGDSNVAFFKQLTDAGITADKIPVMSFSIAEEEVGGVGVDNLKGHYVAWNYYETTKTPENDAFVKAYKTAYGDKRVTDDPIEAGYIGVHIWALAATKAGSFDVDKVREAAKGMTFAAPEGTVTVDGDNQHLYKPVRIGKVNEQGLIDEVWATDGAIKPDPYLSTYDWFKE